MSAETYKRTILTQLHTLLKPMGFRKKGQYFSMDKNDTVLFVQLQSSSKSTKDRLVVTINLGIFSRTVAERLGIHTNRTSLMRIGENASDDSCLLELTNGGISKANATPIFAPLKSLPS